MSYISDAELYSLMTNVNKPPKHFDFPETERSLGLSGSKSLHGFVTPGGRMVPIAFLVFYLAIKLWEVLVWKIFTENHTEMANSSKNIQKTSKCCNGDTQKESNITYKISR